MPNALPISRLIKITVNLSPQSAASQNLSTLLILTSDAVIDVVTRLRSYSSLDQVAADFGTMSPAYLAAVLYFEQAPQPAILDIGRWAKTATHGQLFGAPLSAAQQAMSVFTAITDGGFSVHVDGVEKDALSLNFSGQTNLNGVASIIQAALTGATVAWDSVNDRFVITSATTGASSTLSFATPPPSGGYTDISGILGLISSTTSGVYIANGIVAETALAAVILFDANFAGQWYALTIPEAVDADHLAVAAYIEGANTKHIYGVSTAEGGVITPGNTGNIAFELKALKYIRSLSQYSSSNPYAATSLIGRAITVDYNGNSTSITLMYKQEPGIVPENLGETAMETAEANNCNVFVAYNNNTAIIDPGVMASGDFIDIITGLDWFVTALQTAVYNALYTTTTKIPQTDAGMHIIGTVIENECAQGVTNGFLAPGQWNAGGFGELATGNWLSKGFYVYFPPIATQLQSDRETRVTVPFQVAIKLAGAVHDVVISVNVNR